MKIKTLIFSLVMGLVVLTSCNESSQDGTSQDAANLTLSTSEDSVFYSLGISIGNNLKNAGLESVNTDMMSMGFNDIMSANEPLIAPEQAEMILQQYFNDLQMKKNEKNRLDGEAFLEKNKSAEGVITLENGIQYIIIKSGEGKQANLNSTVTVHYHGTLIDGTVFDSSVDRGEPAQFPVNGVIQGWQEIIPMMKVGDKWKVFIPQELAYGERVRPGGPIQPFMALIFEIELIDVQDTPPQDAAIK